MWAPSFASRPAAGEVAEEGRKEGVRVARVAAAMAFWSSSSMRWDRGRGGGGCEGGND